MSSITLNIESTLCTSNDEVLHHKEKITGTILYEDTNYIVVSLSMPISVVLPTVNSLHKYKTQYIRLNKGTNDIAVYILHDRSANSINILEHLLRTSPDITRTYIPLSQHTYNICT